MKNRIRKRLKWALALALIAFAALNLFAYIHAYQMTHFVVAGERTPNPEKLSFTEQLGVFLTGVIIPKPSDSLPPYLLDLPHERFTIAGYNELNLDVLHLQQDESQAAILFFHGYAGTKSQVALEAAELFKAGYDIYAVDFHGSGGSSGNTTSIGYHEAEDVRALYKEVRQRHPDKKLVLYGFSMGASAVITAMHRFDVAPEAAILAFPFSSLLETTENRFRTMGVPAFPVAHLLTFWGGFLHGFDGLDYEPAEFAKTIRVPILQLHGTQDPRVSEEQARSTFEAFRGPKKWILFTESGHVSFLRTEPTKWRQTVLPYISNL